METSEYIFGLKRMNPMNLDSIETINGKETIEFDLKSSPLITLEMFWRLQPSRMHKHTKRRPISFVVQFEIRAQKIENIISGQPSESQ